MDRFKTILLILLIPVSCNFITPYFISKRLLTSLEERNAKQLAAHIDFEAVRKDLYKQLHELLNKPAPGRLQNIILAAANLKTQDNVSANTPLDTKMTVQELTDKAVTPQALSNFIDNLKTNSPDIPQGLLANITTHWGYSFREYLIRVEYRSERVDFIMAQQGAFTWKITRAILPLRRRLESRTPTEFPLK